MVPRKDLPVVSFGLADPGRRLRREPRARSASSDFVAAMLRRGTKTRSADDISRAIDFVGGSLDAQATNESTTATLLGAVEGRPALPRPAGRHPAAPVLPREPRWGRCAIRCWPSIAARYDNPHALANAHFDNLLFGEKHPEGWVLTRRGRQQDHARATWRRSGRRSTARTAPSWRSRATSTSAKLRAGDREGVRRLGARQRSRRVRRWTIPPSPGTRILLVDRPDLDAGDDRARPPGDQARRSALVRGDADELRAGRLRLLVAPDDRGARQARPDLRHRVVVRRVAVRGRLPRRRRRRRTRPPGRRCSRPSTRSGA